MKYEVTKDLETGNTLIDLEHRELFRAVNQLFDSCSQGKGRAAMESATQFLLNYVDKHFVNEENLQKNNHYPNLTAHKAFHADHKKTLRNLVAQISIDNPSIADLGKLNGHIAVLVNHIRIEDKKLGAFLKQS